MFRKMCVNVVFLCVALLSAVGAVNYPPLAGAQGVEPLSVPASTDQGGIDSYVRLLLHADGSDQGTSFTDSEATPKTVTNTETYDSYTKLMLHMENNITDSATGKTVTNNNATFSSSVYKMGGYSGVFNGSNAYLSLADSDDWNFGTGDFTIDFWVKFNIVPTTQAQIIYSQWQDSSNVCWVARGSTTWEWYAEVGGGVRIDFSGTSVISANTWYHIAIVRSVNTWYIFQDGVQIATTTNFNTMPDHASVLYIGQKGNSSLYFNGYLDELRISKGIVRWTSDFTPPSSPYGKVYTVTGTKKFGAASGEFKGSGEYLSLADSDDWWFNNQDFTVDFWVRFNTFPTLSAIYQQYVDTTHYASIFISGSSSIELSVRNGGSEIINPVGTLSSVTTGVWYHFALVRNGNICFC